MEWKRSRRWLIGALALLVAGCGGMEGDEWAPGGAGGKADDPGMTQEPALSLVTFNAGLARGAVALAEERVDKIIDALSQTDNQADVLCLQEVWTDDDAGKIQNALRGVYPHFFRQETEDNAGKSVECGIWSTYQLDRCVKKNCAPQGISTEECVLTACADRYNKLSDECKLCLAANTASPTWCAIWPGAPQYAWDGRNGLLLLSKHPIQSPTYTPFDTVLVKRGVITADIQSTTVHCTHMSSDLKVVPYPKDRNLTSWIEEQKDQVVTIQNATTQGACNVLLGDLNTGPDTPTLTGEVPQTFNLLNLAGFEEPWGDAPCTWCSDNPLAGSDTDRQLDHIMVSGCGGMELRYRRVMDRKTLIPTDDKTLLSRLSDHYGLKLELVPVVPPVQ